MRALFAAGVVFISAVATPLHGQSTVRLSGLVVDAATNEPLTNVEIAFLWTSQPPRGSTPLRATTNGRGEFSIDIPSGEYRYLARHPGYIPSGTNGAPTPITVSGRAQTMADIRLVRGGTIAGRIVDVRGKPLPRLLVDAVIPGAAGTAGPARPAGGSVQTNDLGEFRVSGLPSGRYYVAARPMPDPLGSRKSASSAFVSTYYPGVAEQSAASVVDVTSGSTIAGVDFSIFEAPTRSVSGTVVDERNRPVKGAVVTFSRVGEVMGMSPSVTSEDRGRFRMMLPEGDYVLVASIPVRTSNGGRRTSFGLGGPLALRLTVGAETISDLRLVAQQTR
jgi:hypothetical protein